ncbi:unnamed protein product, partial [Ectocarpus sp. 8 AP-2014]
MPTVSTAVSALPRSPSGRAAPIAFANAAGTSVTASVSRATTTEVAAIGGRYRGRRGGDRRRRRSRRRLAAPPHHPGRYSIPAVGGAGDAGRLRGAAERHDARVQGDAAQLMRQRRPARAAAAAAAAGRRRREEQSRVHVEARGEIQIAG